MKLQIPTKDLRDALGKLAHIPGAHGSSLFTQVVTFEAGFGGLTLTRMTSEARITITIESASVLDDGPNVMVGHVSISELVGRMRDKEVTLTTDEKHMRFKGERFDSKLALIGDEATAAPPDAVATKKVVNMPVEELIDMLKYAGAAMSKNKDADPMFCGICLRRTEDRLAFISNDRRRCHIGLSQPIKFAVDCIIASEGVDAILKAISMEAGTCAVSIGENSVGVICGGVDLQLSLLAESFPNITPFIEQSRTSIKSKVLVDKQEFVEILKNIAPIGYGESKLVRAKATAAELTFMANNKRDAELNEWMACQCDGPFECGVAASQVATAAEMMKPDENGKIEVCQTSNTLFIQQPDKLAMICLARSDVF